tara:strand:+ start:140 stop:490 length:351 start_codon:yes stop_codon:yes gene_type:complete
MSIWYFANVKDTEGIWHLKTGICTDQERLARRFKDSRTYDDHEYIETIQYNCVEDAKSVEKSFQDLQVGKKWKQYGIPNHFYGKTEVLHPEVTKEEVLNRIKELKIPAKTTLKEFV